MKKLLFTIALTALLSIGVSAQTKKDGTPDMRYKANKEAYGTSTPSTTSSTPSYSSSSYTSTTSRPVYSGEKHTESHGGAYPGSTNSHHKNGTYKNSSSNNRYGIHKKK